MTFDEVIAALRRVRPDAALAATAQRGKYHDQARKMDNFDRVDELTYMALGKRGKPMWLYINQVEGNQAFGKICCGNKG